VRIPNANGLYVLEDIIESKMLDHEMLIELTEGYLKSLIAEASGSLDTDFDTTTPFGELGIDSFRVLKIVKSLETDFGTLPKTLLFENFNIESLARYFVDKHRPTLDTKFAKVFSTPSTQPLAVTAEAASETPPRPEVLDSPRPASAMQVPAAAITRRQVPVRMLEKDLSSYPELEALVQGLYDRHKNEGSVSRGTRNIAPNLFIGSARKGYFNYCRTNDTVLTYAYTGPEDYFPEIAGEISHYCREKKLQLNLFLDSPVDSIDGVAFSATPFGVIQRVLDIQNFTLEGGAMRRLRYQVAKFEKAGACRTQEYKCGTDKDVDRSIAEVIVQWCATKPMVNPLIHRVREEILAGNLHPQHRIFLTHLDDKLQNVILISRMCDALNGYLMDLEFYGKDMPLGGLEFAIVKMIEILAAEGCDMLSLGGTYGCRLETSAKAEPEVDKILDDLHKQNIFNDEGNLQFKNKFRPENRSIYLCRPVGSGKADNVIDIIMMIADPAKAQTSDAENHNVDQIPADGEAAPAAVSDAESQARLLKGHARARILAEFGFNPLKISPDRIDYDLKTDSWAQLGATSFVQKQMAHLRTQLQQPVDLEESLSSVFPFKYVALTDTGRSADHFFCKAWPKKGVILQNLLFPTCIYHQIDKGFTPKELPHPEVFELESNAAYKSNLNWADLQDYVTRHANEISYVCIEVSDNAAGGQPVSVQHLWQVKELLAAHSIALVIDGTRILENAQYLIEREQAYAGKTLWEVAREILSYADVVIGSLCKDFCVNKGGVIATNDKSLFRRVQNLMQQEGAGLTVLEKKLVALALHNRRQVESLVVRRMQAVQSIWQALKDEQVPVLGPAGGHCVVIDVKRLAAFRDFENPIASFVAWLYLNTGIRAGAHSVGMQKNTPINGMVRLAIPIGLKKEQSNDIAGRLVRLFRAGGNIPELKLQGDLSTSFGMINATYDLVRFHALSLSSLDAPESLRAAVSSEKIVLRPLAPTASAASPIAPAVAASSLSCPDIAIVGMAGRYPKAKDLAALWENLKAGRDCVGDIPADRLTRRMKNPFTRTYRGGFLEDVDKFDSLFFSISPREAEVLDPQERLFLEVAWEALEDAGYYPEILAQEDAPRKVGVFVGAVWAMYQMVGVEEKLAGNNLNPNSFLWSIANRVSFWMNLTGPSLTVDTACSSSLTALYLAYEAIRNGDCTSAIVGGVNLDLHQHKFDINSAGGALSRDGLCRSFGVGANGYVAGEGVGAIFLKPLDKALEDRDNIYGIIRGAQVNHGGRTSGYTVPNPKVQGELIAAALEKSGVDARSIGYIEAHGTGTELGDPIEISGLTNAFEAYKVANQTCPIGSIKTNIGHLEAAAGVASVCKVLLQIRHRQLVPSLHSAQLNEHIDFENSPFYVQQRLEDWRAKEIDGIQLPLRAGVSSFGAGGANAHIVIESYELPAAEAGLAEEGYVFPLSARNDEQLQEMARRLRRHLEQDADRTDLRDVAFTLQNGRKSFDQRLAVVAGNRKELVERLGRFVDGRKDDNVLVGHIKNAEGVTKLLSRKEKEQFIELLAQSRDPRKLVQLWIDGLLPDCRGFMKGKGRRISLPTYPFADKRHWIAAGKPAVPALAVRPMPGIHPLIDSNESTFQRQLFRKSFHEHEFFLRDHVVSNLPTLPGTAYLDLARKAGEMASGRKVSKIRNVTWVSPLTARVTAPTEAFIELKPTADAVLFEVFSECADGKKKLHSQGKLVYGEEGTGEAAAEYIDIDAIRARCQKVIDGKDAYPLFKAFGLDYGPSFQVLQEVFKSEDEVLGVLRLPDVRSADFDEFVLHPCLLDASMQAGVAGQLGGPSGQMIVPYSIGEVEILHPLTRTCYSYLTKVKNQQSASSGVSRENVVIVDENGRVLARISESVGVPLASVHEKPAAGQKPAPQEEFEKLYYSHVWQPSPLADRQSDVASLLIFAADDRLRQACAARNIPAVLVLPREGFEELSDGNYGINPQDHQDYARLFAALGQRNWVAEKICFAWPDASEPDDEEVLARVLDRGVYAFLHFCQALIEQKIPGRVQILYLYCAMPADVQAHNEAINGFVRSLRLENPKIDCKVLDIRQEGQDGFPPEQVLEAVLAELHEVVQKDITVRYVDGIRCLRVLKKLELPEQIDAMASGVVLKKNGVYLITGGAGGLGFIFAEFLARECQARLILSGRSALPAERKAQLDRLRSLGAEVLYVTADVSRSDDLHRLLAETRSTFGTLNGVIHSAGVLRDSFLRNKTREEMEVVFAPKIYGTFLLDELTQNDNLDFFVLFSSLAAVGGNAGQCDYAFANHYMDSFAAGREALRARGQRTGHTLSISWSLWADGGMKLDEQTEAFFQKNLGIVPLRTEVGLEAFVAGLSLAQPHIAVLEGLQAKIELAWGLAKKEVLIAAPAAVEWTETAAPVGDGELTDLLVCDLSETVMELLKLSAEELSVDSILLDLGFDSIGFTAFANAINKRYRLDINPVLFFEYPSIRAIAGVLTSHHRSAVENILGGGKSVAARTGPAIPVETAGATDLVLAINKGEEPPTLSPAPAAWSRESRFALEPIAIVGIAGVMPQSENVEEFWDNLRNARNMVTEIPRDRWMWEDYHGDPVKEVNKSNSRWGGFMKEVDKFDPLFFGITPREAEMMDPQQRIFIETVWNAIEDSGHKVSDLSGTKTGLFVGASAKDYIDVLAEHKSSLDGYSASGNSHSILANRVSFLFNLRGPSAPLDTACSSSLIALHRAIESIHTGSSDMAIVGGVQVMLTPIGHISLSSAGMLSPEGKCRTFDKDANGYVRGEGSGAIFIKPLAKAEADGNSIYAVVKATAENHGGRVTMLTAPNPKAQAELLLEAYDKAQIDPSTIGYIECHGTGTSLGDPIEIQALKKSFSDLYRKHGAPEPKTPHCGLSSVKTNIGHLEPAAGIASLLKVLLAIKHREIPGMLHFENLNSYIDLGGSPFYVVDKTIPWPAPMGSDGVPLPRRAGVSSFGWGGANAHAVLEEYIAPQRPASPQTAQLVVLSAKSEDRLQAYAAALLTHLEKHDVVLADVAYTLQVGRDPMDERLALIAVSVEELAEKLRAYGAGNAAIEGLYRGRAARGKRPDMSTGQTEEGLARLAATWVQGGEVDWNSLHPQNGVGKRFCRRVSLPTYPFARERHWIQTVPEKKRATNVSILHSSGVGSLLVMPHWEATSVALSSQHGEFHSHIVLLGDLPGVDSQELASLIPGIDLKHLPLAGAVGPAEGYGAMALACFEAVQTILKVKPKGKTLFQMVIRQSGQDHLAAGLVGLIRSARLESPKLVAQLILSSGASDAKALADQLLACHSRPNEALFKSEYGKLSVLRWQRKEMADPRQVGEQPIAFRDRGVYLITGGLGGLGLLFAKEILGRVPSAIIVFTGRSELTADKGDALVALSAALSVPAGQLAYRQLDLQRLASVEALVTEVVGTYGRLNGVIHSAGMTRDSLIVNKTTAEFTQVLAPKVTGTVHLDLATRDVDLDFLTLFSSVSGALGNVGQADYAAANGFMDQYAAYRNQLVREKRRRGHTLSINWPLWEEGGMQVDAKTRVLLLKTSGMLPMRTATGMMAFHRSLELGAGQVLVMEGQVERLSAQLFLEQAGGIVASPSQTTASGGKIHANKLRELVLADLRSFQARSI